MLKEYYADLHIHIGQDMMGKPVKVSASPNLTLQKILAEARLKKGLHLVGIVDSHSPNVQLEINQLINEQTVTPLTDGGIRYHEVTLLLGTEIEVYDAFCKGPIHVLVYLPTIERMEQFSKYLSRHVKNIYLSTQRFYGNVKELQQKVKTLNGLFIPAHVFTPFKSLYGKGVERSLTEVMDPQLIDAIELGLSSDTRMADQIAELHNYTYVTNSDSHSLNNIGREYQQMALKDATFQEVAYALKNEKNRKIIANYGFNPKLGKYYRTVCTNCTASVSYNTKVCPKCAKKKIVNGVYDRIQSLKITPNNLTQPNRPPYLYQVPLHYLPGIGPKTLQKLLATFPNEMYILHQATENELNNVVSPTLSRMIIAMRSGKLHISSGGGGKYGTVIFDAKKEV